MDLVIDANILFAALIKDGKTTEQMFKHRLFAPKYLLLEFGKYETEILEKNQLGIQCNQKHIQKTDNPNTSK